MLKYVALAIPVVIAFYTVLFGWENLKEKNYSGAVALVVLALVICVLPIYILVFKS